MTMVLKQVPSPNFNRRPCPVDAIVLHATADRDTAASVAWCCTPKSGNPNPVSYHAIVDRDGTVFALVETDKRAWHAGISTLDGRPNCNDYSIGLSFGNDNEGEALTDAQFAVGVALCAAYIARYPAITLDRITTHALVARPLGRKTDPAPPFNLPAFLEAVRVDLGQ